MSSEFYRDLITTDDHVLSSRKLLLELSHNQEERQEQLSKIDEVLDERLIHMAHRDSHELMELIVESQASI